MLDQHLLVKAFMLSIFNFVLSLLIFIFFLALNWELVLNNFLSHLNPFAIDPFVHPPVKLLIVYVVFVRVLRFFLFGVLIFG